MDVSLLAVVAATVGQFIFGMIWYTPLFGKLWGKMHGFDNLSKEKQKEMMSKMGPWYTLQLVVTVVTAYVLAKLMVTFPDYSPYTLANLIWLGFVVPTQVSGVIFGGTEAKWITKKIAVLAFGSLGCLWVAVAILNMF